MPVAGDPSATVVPEAVAPQPIHDAADLADDDPTPFDTGAMADDDAQEEVGTLTLALDDAAHANLADAADRFGLTPEDFAVRLLTGALANLAGSR